MKKSFLFLQGPHGPFFAMMGKELGSRGHRVSRVNFNGGDWFDWKKAGAVRFNGDLSQWGGFCRELLKEHRITDLVVYGDCRPLHHKAIELAKADNIRVHVFEEGYIRPDWVTLEEGGVNGYSSLPRNAEWYLQAARNLEASPYVKVGPSLKPLIGECIKHYAACMLLKPFFPKYRTHRFHHPIREAWHWVLRSLKLRREQKRSSLVEAEIVRGRRPYFLVCLQVSIDSQITCHSPFCDMKEFISHVIDSFARHASSDAYLVFKNHPQDHGGFGYRELIAEKGAAAGVQDRCRYIERGNLPLLIKGSKGVVLVNSTVGTSALFHRKPTIALGDSIYNFAGLTYQEGIDAFWKDPVPPDPEVFRAFRHYLLHSVLINGGFYNPSVRALLLSSAVQRLEAAAPLLADADLAVVSPSVKERPLPGGGGAWRELKTAITAVNSLSKAGKSSNAA
jgi:capsular polysaccharide export protein